MTIWLVRHGETELNAARVLQPADTPLSAHGERQAQALAERLADEPLAGILSSDLPRALQTAQRVAKRTGLAVQTSTLLHERHFGDWRGQPYDSLQTDPLGMSEAPPGGESAAVFGQRCRQAFDQLLQARRALGGPLLVVTHGLVIRELLAALPSQAHAETTWPRLGNTSLTVIDAEPPHTLRRLNCTLHLQGRLQEAPDSLSGG